MGKKINVLNSTSSLLNCMYHPLTYVSEMVELNRIYLPLFSVAAVNVRGVEQVVGTVSTWLKWES